MMLSSASRNIFYVTTSQAEEIVMFFRAYEDSKSISARHLLVQDMHFVFRFFGGRIPFRKWIGN